MPDFTYKDISALSVAILYNSTEDIETFLNSGCDINDGRVYRSEIKTECDNPLFKQLGIECRYSLSIDNRHTCWSSHCIFNL